jgi:hypothetical protein
LSSHNGDRITSPNPQEEFLEKLNQEQYLKELELLMKTRRELANTPIDPKNPPKEIPYPIGVGLTHPITDKNKLYEDRQKRLKEKTCSRCGYYFKYDVRKSITEFKPHDIYHKPEEKFWSENFEIVRETIPHPGTLDDDFYDVCKSCQSDILHNTNNFTKHVGIDEAKQKLISLEEDEEIRYKNQLRKIEKLQEVYRKDMKEKQQDKKEAAIVREEQRKEQEREERKQSRGYTPRPRQNMFSSPLKTVSPTLNREAKE